MNKIDYLEKLLRNIWNDEEFVTGVISAVSEVNKEHEMISFIEESDNPSSDIIIMYATDLHRGNE